ncbi:MAG TPA: glycosyltransferase family 4 protein [Thermoanaerobaculia bacterium]|nr:glycosyltransferase family 4 protein [Thermoanaerobaculia bacterium]
MRVLLVANTLPPRDVSGVGEQVLQLAAGLRQGGDEVEVLGRGPGGVAGPKVLFPLLAVPAVWRALRRFHPEVVQLHESDGGLAALLFAWLTPRRAPRPLLVALLQVSYREERRAVRPLVFEGRVLGRPSRVELRFRRFKAPLQIWLGRATVRGADRVLAPSAATAAELRRDYGVERIAVVPNVTGGLPVPPEPVVPSAPGAHSGMAAPSGTRAGGDGGGRGEGYLLLVGRLRIRKGVEVLLAALAELRQRLLAERPRAWAAVRLQIAGDGEHRAALERTTAELGLGGTVAFLGRQAAPAVRGLLQGAAALVVPSIYEGMPLVVLEAMEAALPVVASRVAGIPEVVEDGTTGWLVPPEDPRRLAAALAELLAEPEEARRRGAAGRRRLDERFRPAHAAAQWRAAVLGPGGGRPASAAQTMAASERTLR